MENVLIILIMIAVSLIRLCNGFNTNIKSFFVGANKFLVVAGVATTILLIPMLFFGIIILTRPPLPIMFMLMIMSVATASDLSVKQVEALGGDAKFAASIQVTSALLSIITIPILLKLYVLALGLDINVVTTHIIYKIAIAQFIPMTIGITLRQFFPNYTWLTKYVISFATPLLILALLFFVIYNFADFFDFKIQAYLIIAFATLGAFLVGVLCAGKYFKRQIALALETGLRNPGLTIVLANEFFKVERVKMAMVPYIATVFIMILFCVSTLKIIHKKSANIKRK